jgi:hypothetical protein
MNATTAIAYAVRVIRTPKEGEPYECYLARADVRGRALALSEARLFSDAAAAALAAKHRGARIVPIVALEPEQP